jgi:hypothetical protein
MQSPKWAPFAQPPQDQTNIVSSQLLDLINKMVGPAGNTDTQNYLSAMWDMINAAITNMPFPPSQYSAYANAIVGKPLALINVGWSLELAEPVKKAQFALPVEKLPGGPGFGSTPGVNPSEEDMMASYKFPVKIGDVSFSIYP